MSELDTGDKTVLKPEPLSKRALGAAAWTVMHNARDADDARLLLAALGLDTKQARFGRDVKRRRGLA